MDSKIQHIRQMADFAFERRGSLLSLWQEIADNFYPERADFTVTRSLGTDFASNLTTSFPIQARRDLGDMMSSMLRDQSVFWYKVTTTRPERLTHEDKIWLEDAGKTMWNAIYDRASGFQRATKEGDHDYVSFGQCAISKEINFESMSLLFRCWHLRDMAWLEQYDGSICPIFRKWNPSADELNQAMKGKVSQTVKEMLQDPKRRFSTVNMRHAVVRSDMYDLGKKARTPYISIFYEQDTGFVNSEEQVWTKIYTIPRWETVSGSQYAYSPAVVAALPDARLIQQMTLVLLEAGEKAVNPPLIATQDAVRSDVHQYAGGLTWVDAEYDERLGDALRPMTINSNGIPHGLQMREEIKRAIEAAFYLDKVGLPNLGGDMTAFETAQRVKEYVRKIIPLFAPIESEYNGSLCEDIFSLGLRNNLFGLVPDTLRGADVRFQFRSPLSENLDRQKAQSFQEAKAMLAETIPLDQTVPRMVNIRKALRDTMEGIGVPMAWIRSEEEMQAMEEADRQRQQAAELLQTMQAGATVGKTIGEAGQAINKMQMGNY